MKEPKEYLKECGFKQYGKECAEEAFNDPELKFVLDAVRQAQIDAYKQGISDLLEMSDGLDMNFQAEILISKIDSVSSAG